jgi:hypothetical protein
MDKMNMPGFTAEVALGLQGRPECPSGSEKCRGLQLLRVETQIPALIALDHPLLGDRRTGVSQQIYATYQLSFSSLTPRRWNGHPPVHHEKANFYQ